MKLGHTISAKYVAIASKADDSNLFREFSRQRKMKLITYCRQDMDKAPHRYKMIKFMNRPKPKVSQPKCISFRHLNRVNQLGISEKGFWDKLPCSSAN